MKILKALSEKLIRLTIACCYQIPWVLVGLVIYFYTHHTFPQKIQETFGIVQAQERLTAATQSTAFMKSMISVSNPVASINYLTSLVDQTVAWSRLSSSQMFASVTTTFALWLVDMLLFIGALYLIWRCIKIYRLKSTQKESARLVLKELKPHFEQLQAQIQSLHEEIQSLKDEKGYFTDSSDTGG